MPKMIKAATVPKLAKNNVSQRRFGDAADLTGLEFAEDGLVDGMR